MSLFKSAALVSALTFLSRITGLIRETLTASIFGAGPLTDAFIVAFRLPNLLRRLFAEGAFTQAFVPILAGTREAHGDAEARRVIDAVTTVLFWALLLVSMIGAVAAPALVLLVASGLAAEPAAFDAATTMTRWMFPYILMISLVSLAAGILNTWGRFGVPAFAPILLNVCFIAAALFLTPYFEPPIYALAAGVVIGGVAQLALQAAALLRLGLLPRISLRLSPAWKEPIVRRVIRQMGPAVLAVSVAQLSLIINTQIASWLRPGSVSWISFSDRLMEFPTALLGVAMGTVLMPSLARASRAGNTARYEALIDWGLRLCVLLALPAMLGLGMLAEPITALVFHHGRFTEFDVAMTSRAVIAYSVGLLGLISVKILAPAFYARQDIRTPVRIGIGVLAVTQLLNLLFVPWIAHAGLALSISVGAWLNAGWLLFGLRRQGLYRPQPGWRIFLAQVAIALLATAAVLWAFDRRFDWIALGGSPLVRAAIVLGIIAAAALAYFVTLRLTGLDARRMLRPAVGED